MTLNSIQAVTGVTGKVSQGGHTGLIHLHSQLPVSIRDTGLHCPIYALWATQMTHGTRSAGVGS